MSFDFEMFRQYMEHQDNIQRCQLSMVALTAEFEVKRRAENDPVVKLVLSESFKNEIRKKDEEVRRHIKGIDQLADELRAKIEKQGKDEAARKQQEGCCSDDKKPLVSEVESLSEIRTVEPEIIEGVDEGSSIDVARPLDDAKPPDEVRLTNTVSLLKVDKPPEEASLADAVSPLDVNKPPDEDEVCPTDAVSPLDVNKPPDEDEVCPADAVSPLEEGRPPDEVCLAEESSPLEDKKPPDTGDTINVREQPDTGDPINVREPPDTGVPFYDREPLVDREPPDTRKPNDREEPKDGGKPNDRGEEPVNVSSRSTTCALMTSGSWCGRLSFECKCFLFDRGKPLPVYLSQSVYVPLFVSTVTNDNRWHPPVMSSFPKTTTRPQWTRPDNFKSI